MISPSSSSPELPPGLCSAMGQGGSWQGAGALLSLNFVFCSFASIAIHENAEEHQRNAYCEQFCGVRVHVDISTHRQEGVNNGNVVPVQFSVEAKTRRWQDDCIVVPTHTQTRTFPIMCGPCGLWAGLGWAGPGWRETIFIRKPSDNLPTLSLAKVKFPVLMF